MRIGGIELPEKINLNQVDLRLNGAAVRTKFFVQTYVIALYTAQSIRDEDTAIHSLIERSLRMQITTPLATPKAVSDNILSGMREGLGALYHQQRDLVEDLRRVIEASGVQYRDAIDIYYTADGALKLYKNGREIYSNPDGKRFAETIFGMYLGKRPKDAAIKRGLLKGY